MKINRVDFLQTLVYLQSGTSNKQIISESNHFIFTRKHLASYNDNIAVFCPFKSEREFAIPAEELTALMTKLTDETFELKVGDGSLKIKGKKVKAKVVTKTELSEIKDYIDKVVKGSGEGKWNKLPDDFMQGIGLCMFSASKDLTSKELCSIALKGNQMYSSDRQRISNYTMNSKVKTSFMLPLMAVKELVKFKEEVMEEYKIEGNWIFFRSANGYVFCSRMMQGKYRSVEDFFKFSSSKVGKLPAKKLQEALGISSVFAEGEFDVDKLVNVEINGKKKKIKLSSGNDVGSVEQIIPFKKVKVKGRVGFEVNPIFLSEVLNISPNVTLGEDRVQFKSSKFKHLIYLQVRY